MLVTLPTPPISISGHHYVQTLMLQLCCLGWSAGQTIVSNIRTNRGKCREVKSAHTSKPSLRGLGHKIAPLLLTGGVSPYTHTHLQEQYGHAHTRAHCWNDIVVHSEKQLAVIAGYVCC